MQEMILKGNFWFSSCKKWIFQYTGTYRKKYPFCFTLHEFHFTRFFQKNQNRVKWGLPVGNTIERGTSHEFFPTQTLLSLVAAQKILLPFMLAPSDGHHIPKSSFLLGHFSRFYYSEIFSENRMLMHIIIQLSSSQLESLRISR